MNSDHAVLPGARHVRNAIHCQDYAASGEGWVIASDGCSGGDETDLGSRIWTLALASLLKKFGPMVLCRRRALASRLNVLVSPWLDKVGPLDGLATLVALGVRNKHLVASIAGDGGFIFRLKNGEFFAVEVSYSENKPLYIDYFRTEDQRKSYMENAGSQTVLTTVEQYTAEGVLLRSGSNESPIVGSNPFTVYNVTDMLKVSFDDIEVAVACTDGVFSRPASRGETLADVVGFKNYAGQFARRRIGSVGSRWAKDGTMPIDDLAISAIHLE